MPELPEVESVRRRIAPVLEGRRFERVEISDPRLVRPYEPAEVAAELTGERVECVDRRGKYLIVRFESGRALLIHLRMTGSLGHHEHGIEGQHGTEDEEPHRRAVVRLDNGSDVTYRDVRRFGTWLLLEAGGAEPCFEREGGGGAAAVGGWAGAVSRAEGGGGAARCALHGCEARRQARAETRADQGGPPRPATPCRHGEHLRRRGALARTHPPAQTRRDDR